MNNTGPTFMCIGAQKAGTTWLYANIARHPDVAMPPLKEIHYFDEVYRNINTNIVNRLFAKEGMNKWWWREKIYPSFCGAMKSRNLVNLIWFVRYYFFPRNMKWYDRLFDRPENKISGDITPDYCILDRKTIGLIHKHYPKLKIIYLIRNPVDRAWSALKMRYVTRRGKSVEDIDEFLIEDYFQEFEAFNNIEKTILNWTAYYPNEQFYIGFNDALHDDPASFFKNVLDYLSIDHTYNHTGIKKRVFKGAEGKLPSRLKAKLTRKSIDQVRFLHSYVDASQKKYPAKWLRDAEETLR